MPTASKRPCQTPGCRELVVKGHCATHAARRDRERGTRTERGYDNAWLRAARSFLADNPYCLHHHQAGEIKRAEVVDHIKAHRGNRELFWDVSNWQPLCKPCHDRKTATVDSTFGRL
jgi:5-methylcytosine-specific restriction protein A